MRILYLGTPEFAVAPLQKLIENTYNVVAVITAPDKPAGRGFKLQQSAVKQYAIAQNLPVLQPEKLRDETFLQQIRDLRVDIAIVVAFRMMPEILWSMPRLGTFNLHASLLPQYRGAAPIHWAIINGETETGVTTFFLKHEIDTGEIILQEKIAITPNETCGILYNRLMHAGADLVVKTMQIIENGNYTPMPQPTIEARLLNHAPKIHKEHARIDFNTTVEAIKNIVRGMHPAPCAWCVLNDTTYKIHTVHITIEPHQLPIGQVLTDAKTYVKVACSNGFIHIETIQAEGKKPMLIQEFLRGNVI